MFTLRINREKYAAQSVTGVVVDGETYAPRGQNIRTQTGLLVNIKYTTDTGRPYVSVTDGDDNRRIFLTWLDEGDCQPYPVHEVLLDCNRTYHIQAWANVA